MVSFNLLIYITSASVGLILSNWKYMQVKDKPKVIVAL